MVILIASGWSALFLIIYEHFGLLERAKQKPFSCIFCMTFWASVIAAALLSAVTRDHYLAFPVIYFLTRYTYTYAYPR